VAGWVALAGLAEELDIAGVAGVAVVAPAVLAVDVAAAVGTAVGAVVGTKGPIHYHSIGTSGRLSSSLAQPDRLPGGAKEHRTDEQAR
jgi:hypothetical protein